MYRHSLCLVNYLKPTPDRIKMVLWLLAEGVDISIMVRYTGHADSTLTRWLERMGAHSTVFHNYTFQGLVLTFVQLDELQAKVRTGVQWLWLAIDPVTKIVPSLHLGGRSQEDAYALLDSSDVLGQSIAKGIPLARVAQCGRFGPNLNTLPVQRAPATRFSNPRSGRLRSHQLSVVSKCRPPSIAAGPARSGRGDAKDQMARLRLRARHPLPRTEWADYGQWATASYCQTTPSATARRAS